jgi:DNA helicase-2/ATP-dependent DNA helicase PcrA
MPKKTTPKQITLNEEQQEAVNFETGYACLLAGPGSGKTQVLVQRLARLIRDGIAPDDLLSLSFTKTAAKNLRDRVEAQVGELRTTKPAGSLTFHSLALQFATIERSEFPFELAEFPLADEPKANRLCFDAAKRHELDPRALRPMVSLYRRKRVRPAEAIRLCEDRKDSKGLKLALAYKEYEKRCRAEGLLDFDDLIFYMVEILDKKSEVRARWKRDWIQLDESQDMSKIEWNLARLVAGTSVLAVGDVSQGIYGFRGSDSKLFAKMEEIFPGTVTLFLSCNYRSTPEIVDFIRPISRSEELAKKFHTFNPSGSNPEIRGFSSPTQEAAWVIQNIKEEMNDKKH